ncbi:MAG TPA: Ig-like domain-containing protein, partial [Candidatus Limnocylindrales bacterium]|nr:Ig-like domain-containing protein [Candidatus Limnocylindrales bacterium]
MRRQGSRWSIAIGALFALSLVAPAAAYASTPITLTVSASATNQFTDVPLELTATVSPAVAGVQVLLQDTAMGLQAPAITTSSGVLTWVFQPGVQHYIGAQFFFATTTDDGTFGAATSNTVEVDLNRHAVTASLTASSDSGSSIVTPEDSMILHARVAAADCYDGGFAIQQLPDGPITEVGSSPIRNFDGTSGCGADINLGPQPLGTLQYEAEYNQSYLNLDASSGPVDLSVTEIPTTTLISTSTTTLEAGTTTSFEAQVSAPVHNNLVTGTGSVTFFDGTTDIGSAPAENLDGRFGTAVIFATLNTVGTHVITAVWSGNDVATPSTSAPLTMNMVKDLAHALDDGLSASTFYPVVDTYADTVTINGEMEEPESVSITITSVKTGAAVRHFFI